MAHNTLFFQERQLNQGGALKKSILNIPKAWASMNRKNALAIDGKGYLQTYICKVEVVSTDVISYLYTAPENWVTKNAVRKWHAFRSQKRIMEGMSDYESTYGANIRPLLHSGHQTTDNAADFYELQSIRQAGVMAGGDWDYTRLAHALGINDENNTTGVTVEELADRYYLTLSGSHVAETGHTTQQHDKYTHVSMVQSYLESRRNMTVNDTSAAGVVQQVDNPLQEFITDSTSSKKSIQILRQEQLQKPPYETADSGGEVPFDPLDRAYGGVLVTTSTYGRDSAIIRVPGGLLETWSASTAQVVVDSNNVTIDSGNRLPIWNIEVLGVVRAEG